jgi:hypothetical protein
MRALICWGCFRYFGVVFLLVGFLGVGVQGVGYCISAVEQLALFSSPVTVCVVNKEGENVLSAVACS